MLMWSLDMVHQGELFCLWKSKGFENVGLIYYWALEQVNNNQNKEQITAFIILF